MPLFPRLTLPSVGKWRYRDFVMIEGGVMKVPMFKVTKKRASFTVIPFHEVGLPAYYQKIMEIGYFHSCMGQICMKEVGTPLRCQQFPADGIPSSLEDCEMPVPWPVEGPIKLEAIDEVAADPNNDFHVLMFGHYCINPRAMFMMKRIEEIAKKETEMCLPLSPYHLPTILHEFEKRGYTVEELPFQLAVMDKESTEFLSLKDPDLLKKVRYMSMVGVMNIILSDFFPAALVVAALLVMCLLSGRTNPPSFEHYGVTYPRFIYFDPDQLMAYVITKGHTLLIGSRTVSPPPPVPYPTSPYTA